MRRPSVRRGSDRADVKALVDNPSELDSYESAAGKSDLGGMSVTALANGNYEHVIIVPTSLMGAGESPYKDLSRFWSLRGLASTNVGLDFIYANYTGQDDQEKIRNFVRDAYANWGTRFVLMGGSSALVPARMLYVEAAGETTTMPSDLYYGCLDKPCQYG